MTLTRIDLAHSPRPRIERLLVAQLALRAAHDRAHLYEVERALVELWEGWPNSHTEDVERQVQEWIGGAAGV